MLTRIWMTSLIVAVALASSALAPPADAQTSVPGPAQVMAELGKWVDPGRGGRAVPYKIYRPAELTAPAPVVVFSHGYGGTRDAAAYLGEHLASHGFVAIHIQHPGSDDSIWRGKPNPLEAIARTPITAEMSLARFGDLPFALDQIEAMNRAGPLAGKLDPMRIGMWGHSFGGVSTMAAAGQLFAGGQLKEPRIRAAAVFSPNRPNGVPAQEAYRSIDIPMLYVTGTNDEVPAFNQVLAERRIAFDHVAGVDQYLVIFNGPDHMAWSGGPVEGGRTERADNAPAREDVKAIGLAFWKAYLRDDKAARAWLTDGARAFLKNRVASYETKPGK
jgi:predicted dienelactone hydrolase